MTNTLTDILQPEIDKLKKQNDHLKSQVKMFDDLKLKNQMQYEINLAKINELERILREQHPSIL